jgi:hypothetical protein
MNKLRQSARGQDCTLQIFPWCNNDPTTVSLCHIGLGSGWGLKSSDTIAVYGCSACHDIIDGRVDKSVDKLELMEIKLRALERTHKIMIANGVIKL